MGYIYICSKENFFKNKLRQKNLKVANGPNRQPFQFQIDRPQTISFVISFLFVILKILFLFKLLFSIKNTPCAINMIKGTLIMVRNLSHF
jgi:hypothetical protein